MKRQMIELPPPGRNQEEGIPPQDKAVKRTTTPSMGFLVLSAKSVQAIVPVSVYLSDTFRSQSFSLSQRLHPT